MAARLVASASQVQPQTPASDKLQRSRSAAPGSVWTLGSESERSPCSSEWQPTRAWPGWGGEYVSSPMEEVHDSAVGRVGATPSTPATMPCYHAGLPAGQREMNNPADPLTVDEIIAEHDRAPLALMSKAGAAGCRVLTSLDRAFHRAGLARHARSMQRALRPPRATRPPLRGFGLWAVAAVTTQEMLWNIAAPLRRRSRRHG